MIRFFCENCGNRVKASDKICRKCGRFFYQVRCGNCNHEGPVEHFMAGCPQCGYSKWGTENEVHDVHDVHEETDLFGGQEPIYRKKMIPYQAFVLIGGFVFVIFIMTALLYVASR